MKSTLTALHIEHSKLSGLVHHERSIRRHDSDSISENKVQTDAFVLPPTDRFPFSRYPGATVEPGSVDRNGSLGGGQSRKLKNFENAFLLTGTPLKRAFPA